MAEAGPETPDVEFRASHRYARMSARKARPVLNLIRGQDVNRAIEILEFQNRRAAFAARKVLRSALANAEVVIQDKRLDIDPDDLLVTDARVDVGPTLKRWLPRARGMATPILKRTCHISITLRKRPEEAAPEKAAARPSRKEAPKKAKGRPPEKEAPKKAKARPSEKEAPEGSGSEPEEGGKSGS